MNKSGKKKKIFAFSLILFTLLAPFTLFINGMNGINQTPLVAQLSDEKLNVKNLLQIQNTIRENTPNPSFIPQLNQNSLESPLFIGKIEAKLLSNNQDESVNRKIIILFNEFTSKEERITIIEDYAPSSKVEYNYNIIPGVSLTVSQKELNNLINYAPQITQISQITLNHQTTIENQPNSLDQMILQEDEANWNAEFSYDNWWIPAVGADNVKYTGAGIKVAVLDTGITVHPDFSLTTDKAFDLFDSENSEQLRIIASKNFTYEKDIHIESYTYDDYGHGTHCAGIIGGNGITSDGKYRGVAPEVSLINGKISNSTGTIEESHAIAAIEWAIEQGADIISMSFGGYAPEVWTMETLATKYASENGVITIASAGNSGPDFFTGGNPASSPYTIAVGSSDINNHVSSFSSLGPDFEGQIMPDIIAPGENIISTLSYGSKMEYEAQFLENTISEKDGFTYISLSGTSMAGPMVAGAVALLLEAFPNANPETIRNALAIGAISIERPTPEGYGTAQGMGLINVPNSIDYLQNIKDTYGDVNFNIKFQVRNLPYAPFDLIRFPGDTQNMNVSIFNGIEEGITARIEFSDFDGITFTETNSDYNKTFTFDKNGWNTFSFQTKINYDAIPGNREGTLKIYNNNTDDLMDSVPIEIIVAFPKGKIYMDSYHGLQDYLPSAVNTYQQIEMYQMIRDLYHLNYSVDYFMQNWTANYNANSDGHLITEDILSDIDILILQAPILKYSDEEIDAITNYFNDGGSVLYLGTLSNRIALNSTNTLLSQLDVGFEISSENLFDYIDYGLYPRIYLHNISNINHNYDIMNNIDYYVYGYGSLFSITNDARPVFTLADANVTGDSYPLLVGYNGTDDGGRGNMIASGDSYLFRNSVYNNPIYYKQQYALLNNSIEYLMSARNINGGNDLLQSDGRNGNLPKASINFNFNNLHQIPKTNSNTIEFAVTTYYPNTQIPISTLVDGNNISATIYFANGTSAIIALNSTNSTQGLFTGSLTISGLGNSAPNNLTVSMKNPENNNIYNYTRKWYYYDNVLSVNNLTFSSNEITREPNLNVLINMTTSINIESSKAYIGIISNNKLSKQNVTEISLNNDTLPIHYTLNSSQIHNSGTGILYTTLNEIGYQDLTPSRWFFNIKNNLPEINENSSKVGGLPLNQTISKENGQTYIVPISVKSDSYYEMEIIAKEIVNFEDNPEDMTISASLFPIYISGGYINFLFANVHPTYDFDYNSSRDAHIGYLFIPSYLPFENNDGVINKEIQTDLNKYFTLLYITVTDLDGGTVDWIILMMVNPELESMTNYVPIIIMFAMIIGTIVLLNYFSKKKQKREYRGDMSGLY